MTIKHYNKSSFLVRDFSSYVLFSSCVEHYPPINDVIQSGVVPRVVTFLSRAEFPKLQVKRALAPVIDLYCREFVNLVLLVFSLRQLGRSPTLLQGHQRIRMSSLKVVLSLYSSIFSAPLMRTSANKYAFKH